MKLHFDPKQGYQLDAVTSVVDVFRGQPLDTGEFSTEVSQPEGSLAIEGDLVIGNSLKLAHSSIIENVHAVQKRFEVEQSKVNEGFHDVLAIQGVIPQTRKQLEGGMNFSVEMETGTGKTYVYLRAVHELHKQYGFRKFVIVVPSLAIKEGVMKNLQITKEHFDLLYGKPEMDFYVYDTKQKNQRKRSIIRQFARSSSLQILVINIDSFVSDGNIINQESEDGIAPIHYLAATSPVVIVDEPQNMETDIRKKAIASLKPLCTLRYSATHKHHYNLLYKLDPVKAYDLGLVKMIDVDSVMTQDSFNSAFVEVQKVTSTKTRVSAKLRIEAATQTGVTRKDVTVRVGEDLYQLSGNRDVYQDGWVVDEIDVANQSVTFTNNQVLQKGEDTGDNREEIQKFQIRRAVLNHFEKEKKLKQHGIKVLTLFFIDQVANYRLYNEDGSVGNGKFAKWFEEAYRETANKPQYKDSVEHEGQDVHNGYFAADNKGQWKDSRDTGGEGGKTAADADAYELIMKDKERLLSFETPLRFIFSHSALREGWDNPNVFQIVTLSQAQGTIRKRQEIGRGLRLPVNQEGYRIHDKNLNVLTIVANESYEDFAAKLQTEIEEECGVEFTGRIKNKNDKRAVTLKKGYKLDENFKDLWNRIKHKTRYHVQYSTDELIAEASNALSQVSVSAPRILSVRVRLQVTQEGIDSTLSSADEKLVQQDITHIPDILGGIQKKTKLSRDTIYRIVETSGKLADILKNPQQFMDEAAKVINTTLKRLMVDGIKYEKIAGEEWEMQLFENEELESYLSNLYAVENQEKTLWDYVQVDSSVESSFAQDLESREDVQFFIKLPWWFKIETPIGGYNPDWAIVFENDRRVYFVAETKSTMDSDALRPAEDLKIRCGEKHFAEFPEVKFGKVTELSDIRF
ncbi:DEAD/DEAH box helicase [Candidatus Peregrinibacteria bacterium CG10_big_fil_rev_8_21_14_0_10_49_24]|nr:MAG: DEAD/DEAH box helicase [Candidatus Peregrinibacteria bacterium CG10_big_fil_rev_8_21_14_0_10_49_24]